MLAKQRKYAASFLFNTLKQWAEKERIRQKQDQINDTKKKINDHSANNCTDDSQFE